MTVRAAAAATTRRIDREAIRFDQIHYRKARNSARRELRTILQLHIQTGLLLPPVELLGTGRLKLLLHLAPHKDESNI
jgi:hypothetical protein